MGSDDEDLFFYTPLKRQKIGCNESVRSSQLSYSQVQERYRNKKLGRSSQTPKTQNKRISSNSIKSSNSNISRLSTINKNSQFKKPRLSKESKNVLNSSVSATTKFNNCNSISQSNLKFNRHKSIDSAKKVNNDTKLKPEKMNQETNIFEDNTPDIDLTQVIESLDSNSSDGDKTALEESKFNHDVQSHSIGMKTIDVNTSTSVNDDNDETDFVNVEDPIQTNLVRVNSWLNSSIEQGIITPKKVEYVNTSISSKNSRSSHEHSITENSRKKSKIQSNQKQENEETKTCIHLHFHVNSPKKFTQPTLDQFFQKSSCNLTPSKTISECSRADTVSKNGNEKDVLKAWNNIMNSKKSNNPGSSKASQVVEHITINQKLVVDKNEKKICPFYKFVEDTSFVVDGFSYGHVKGITSYFLSHFHADHYKGLSGKFQKPIYCSQITANLIGLLMKVQPRYIKPMPLEEPRVIEGVEVTLFDSNHCPGAVMFLFKLTSGKTILHVGDFRAHADMESVKELWNSSINLLYLDTTYLDPCYDFLPQEQVLEKCQSIAKEHDGFNKTSLFVVGTYKIGKEKVYKAIAAALDCKIYVPHDRSRIVRCLEDKEITDRLTNNKLEARVHVVSMFDLSPWKLKQYMEEVKSAFKVLVAIKPTGWEHNSKTEETLESVRAKQIGNIYIYGLPYSEHSSYYELERFIKFIMPGKIIPTVNAGNPTQRNKMMGILKKWQDDSQETFRKK